MNVCLVGSPGTGKTHLATALGLAACRQGKRVRFFSAAKLVTKLEAAQKQYQLERLMSQLDRAELLICDELGYLSFSKSGAELLFSVFAGLALLLACIGIYGVLAYLTTQRVPEIGVRMTLGAGASEVLWLVLRQSLGMIFWGVVVGAATALAAGRMLQHLVEGVRPVEASAFAVTIPVLVLAALFASYLPARRASRIDPISALRRE